uniref:Uncharacterized protein n=1 Tax=Brugia malayi TaxID=6279 RepID=A8QFQ2_BRUMA
MHIHTCTYTHAHTHIHIHTQTHTHTHYTTDLYSLPNIILQISLFPPFSPTPNSNNMPKGMELMEEKNNKRMSRLGHRNIEELLLEDRNII